MKTPTPKLDGPLVDKTIRHDYTTEELVTLGGEMAQALAGLRGIETEFDQVKSSYKARTSEKEALIDRLSTNRMNGFELRLVKCRLVFRPKDRQKDYYLDGADEDSEPVLTEDMTQDDFIQELFQAEARFECRKIVTLFDVPDVKSGGEDSGQMLLGRLDKLWFSSLRIRVGKKELTERLDSEQPASKKRSDAIDRAATRLQKWLKDQLGKEAAKGFDEPITKSLEPERELEE